ncbi:hypothetical protein D6D02_06605 [Aureobasidium pullulans]|nr:hypothetical protein D6D02_06605 [Aureobasidium pullulans]
MSCEDGALKLDTDTGHVLLSPDSRFEWIVGGHQVGVQWEEKELGTRRHLGGPSPVHNNDSSLRLWFAVDQDKNEMLVVLTMSVKSRSKSKARPRSFFLLVPAEDLCISSAIHNFQPIPLVSVPEPLFERPADVVSAKATRILHLSFSLGHKRRSGVVMTTRPYSGNMRGTPLALLDGLKSLSEANQFDVYMKYSSYAQVGLQRIREQIASQHVAFFTPSFDLTDMYRGGWHGDVDLWEAQGWHKIVSNVPSRKRKASSPPLEEPLRAPPAYEQHGTPAPPAYADTASPLPRVPRTPHNEQERPSPRPEIHLTPSSIVCDSIAPGISATPLSPHPLVFSDIGSEPPYSAPHKQSLTHAFLPAQEQLLPSLFPATDPSSLSHLYDHEMGMWLLTAWNLVPNIHFVLIHPLLSVASAVTNNDVQAYRLSRMECAKALSSFIADQRQKHDSINQSEETRLRKQHHLKVLASEPDSLISWLFMLRSEGDIGFMEMLGGLEGRKRIAISAIDDGERFRECMSDFMVMRAAIVLQALLMEGQKVMQRLQGSDGEMVRTEVERFASWSSK